MARSSVPASSFDDETSVAEKSCKTPLDEPDDVSIPLETDGSCGFSKTEPHTRLKICSRDCSSSEVRPMDVETVLRAKCSLSTHSSAPATSLETDRKSNHLPEEQFPGTPPQKTKKAHSTFESIVERGGKKGAESVDKAKAPMRLSPNAFVSLRVSSPSIRCGLEEVQIAMVEKDKAVESVLMSLDKLHVTLSVIRLENKEEEERAGLALLEATREINLKLCLHKQPLQLNTSGLGSFGESVVFAEIAEKEELRKITDIVRAVFETHGFQDMGKKDFSPHLTIAKMSRNQRGRGRGGGRGRRRGRRQEGAFKGICEDLYAEFKDREFGVERVTAIELLSMTHPPAQDQYYHCFQQYSFEEIGTHSKTRASCTSQQEN